ncbi:hypothetical protein H4582DRAFT_2131256 [Lactarius indigo]|nr:hypothetical protein H4582DRAFT_2131256 [Lactarius indigo]
MRQTGSRFSCRPDRFPGKASSHAHTIMGSNAIGLSTTFNDLRNSECTTCMVKDDKSAYWVPELYYQYKNGSFQVVTHGGMIVYYLQRNAANETVEAFPDGLRMLAGNPYLRSKPNGTPEARAITWKCIDFNGPDQPETSGFANTNCPGALRAQIFFPACWDGVNLDSADHKSHMAYPMVLMAANARTRTHTTSCPSSSRWFSVAPFNNLHDGGRFVLANGDPTGFGLHGDFADGWDKDVLSRAVKTCTANSGVIEDCSVFQNEGRFVSNADMNSCAAPNPFPNELVAPSNALLPNLPGCVAVTNGPAPATAADVVPGCMSGSGNPVPISTPPQNTSMSMSSTSSSMPPPSISPASPPAKPSRRLQRGSEFLYHHHHHHRHHCHYPCCPAVRYPSGARNVELPPATTGQLTHQQQWRWTWEAEHEHEHEHEHYVWRPRKQGPGVRLAEADDHTACQGPLFFVVGDVGIVEEARAVYAVPPSPPPPPSPSPPHKQEHQHQNNNEDEEDCDEQPPPAPTHTVKNASVPMRRRHHARRAGHGSNIHF